MVQESQLKEDLNSADEKNDAALFKEMYASEEEHARKQDDVHRYFDDATTASESSINEDDKAEPFNVDLDAEVQSHTSGMLDDINDEEVESHNKAKLSSQLRPYVYGSRMEEDNEITSDEEFEDVPIGRGLPDFAAILPNLEGQPSMPSTLSWNNELSEAGADNVLSKPVPKGA